VKLTAQELASGRLDDQRLETLRVAFEVSGIVALEDAVPAGVIAGLRDAVHEHKAANGMYITQQTLAGEETNVGCSFFPWIAPFNAPEIVAHPILLQLLAALFEGEFTCRMYNTNLSAPGSLDQPVHVDVGTILDDGTPRNAQNVSVQVLLCDFTLENGSTELWPGTHRYACQKGEVDFINRTARELPSMRASYPAGSIFLRDPSVWHRGMGNRTNEWREMLSLYFAPAGSVFADAVFGRALELSDADLDALPADARTVWAPNLVAHAG
jgi:ectoine hydroxylase-related dioxygenase (phytanoyl-CoA dioxygenase family)